MVRKSFAKAGSKVVIFACSLYLKTCRSEFFELFLELQESISQQQLKINTPAEQSRSLLMKLPIIEKQVSTPLNHQKLFFKTIISLYFTNSNFKFFIPTTSSIFSYNFRLSMELRILNNF